MMKLNFSQKKVLVFILSQKFSRTFSLLFLCLFSCFNLSAQLHSSPTCATQYNLTWDSTPSASGEVNWSSPGSLSNTFTNVDNSGVNFTFSFTGDTGTLGDWNFLGGSNTPGVGTNASGGGVEVLEYFTDGFNSSGIVTITMTFSKPIAELGFDIYHVNGSGPNGDSYTITANTSQGNTIYPTFTSSATPSYTTNSSGFINSNNNSTAGNNANVGVNFSDLAGITSITMIWDECTACTPGTAHGSAFSNFTFCKIMDTDSDGVSDFADLDDDNDGIPDVNEQCTVVVQNTANFNSPNYPSPNTELQEASEPTGDGTTANLPGMYGGSLDITATIISDGAGATPVWSNGVRLGSDIIVGDYLYLQPTQVGEFPDDRAEIIFEFKNGPATTVSMIAAGLNNNDAMEFEASYLGVIIPITAANFSNFDPDISVRPSGSGLIGTGSSGGTSVNSNRGTFSVAGPVDKIVVILGKDGGSSSTGTATTALTSIIFYEEGSSDCDSDGDGIFNYLDLDSDNDGIPDMVEAGAIDVNGDGLIDYPTPNDPTSMVDLDGDGLADKFDDTDTGGGTPGWTNGIQIGDLDSDNDGFSNFLDLDADNDGIPDIVEAGAVDMNGDGLVDNSTDNDFDGFADIYDSDDDGTPGVEDANNPLLMTGGTDTNGDGIANDAAITFINGESINADTDGDGLPDHLDLDADNDGIPDLVEAGGIDSDGNGLVDVTTDADGDGFADIFDTDDDGTLGVEDANDALVQTGGTDTDGDGKADDAAITFIDGDNVSSDTDGDGLPDHLDLDADNDGIPDIVEAAGATPNNDGMVDTATAPWDSDNDGLADIYDENNSGTALVETTADSNADGKVNATESMVAGGTNNINADMDTYPNHLDLDADNDGITDVVENAGGAVAADNTSGTLDGIVGNSPTVTDTDNNGWHDPSTTTVRDSDSDGIPDYLDIDADNDGIVDYLEGTCSTCPTFVSPSGNDTNGNGVLDMYESLTGANIAGGANIGTTPNVDDDSGNAIPDYLDIDTDGDGSFDWTEGYDVNDNGQAIDDLMTMATNYETATSNGYYANATDSDSDGIPDWLDNQPLVAGYDESTRPPFLNPASAFWYDDDNDGLVDLLDPSQNGTAAPTPDNTVPTTGVDDFDWRDVSASISLPVELSTFIGVEKDCSVLLKWTTASEKDFGYFSIERSANGVDFSSIGFEKTIGSIHGASYDFADKEASNINYYRLKMVDVDGSFEYSKIVFVELECENLDNQINIFPNPIVEEQFVNIEFKKANRENAQLLIVDMYGRVVRQVNMETNEGRNILELNVSDWAAGIYYIQFAGSRFSKKIMIQR